MYNNGFPFAGGFPQPFYGAPGPMPMGFFPNAPVYPMYAPVMPTAASSSSSSSSSSSNPAREAQEAAIKDEVSEIQKYEPEILAKGKHSASQDWIRGYTGEARVNPMTDKFAMDKFHSLEFYVGDAISTMKFYKSALGMKCVAKSDRSTGNNAYSSYILVSEQFRFVITAACSPHGVAIANKAGASTDAIPDPDFDGLAAHDFVFKHGSAVRAVTITVDDATEAYEVSTANGAKGVREPREFDNGVVISEIVLTGDVVLRFIQGVEGNTYLPGYEAVEDDSPVFGLYRIDHVVLNTNSCEETFNYLNKTIGLHNFAEFNTEDVGTAESGLNSVVASNNGHGVLFPINEPTFGTSKKSQIQIYLDHNAGPGVQHIAIKCDDIFETMTKLNAADGFEFLPAPPDYVDEETGESMSYYDWTKTRVGDHMTDEQIQKCKELDILVDIDDDGILLQIFTKPLGDRPTLFIEIIQRLCFVSKEDLPACGNFGLHNFFFLFYSISKDFDNIA